MRGSVPRRSTKSTPWGQCLAVCHIGTSEDHITYYNWLLESWRKNWCTANNHKTDHLGSEKWTILTTWASSFQFNLPTDNYTKHLLVRYLSALHKTWITLLEPLRQTKSPEYVRLWLFPYGIAAPTRGCLAAIWRHDAKGGIYSDVCQMRISKQLYISCFNIKQYVIKASF